MKESQNTEFKLSWRDEYIRHLCAFANTQGGNMFVGVADDGSVVGTISINKLLRKSLMDLLMPGIPNLNLKNWQEVSR